MTVPARGPCLEIFDVIATFLEKCQFRAAADAIRVQCKEKDLMLEADFAKNFRGLVDSSALLLSELESIAYAGQPPAVSEEEDLQLEQYIDGLLRKLMASGQSLSDDKLHTTIEQVLSKDAFSKLASAEGALDRNAIGDNLGINEIDVQRYWEQIQKESGMADIPPADDAAAAAGAGTEAQDVPADAPAEAQQLQAAPQLGGQLQPPAPSNHYVARRPRGSTGADEDWDEGDEYHDDDDPGYRIREIYEAELLAELSVKMTTKADAPQQQSSRGDVVDELASAVSTPAPADPLLSPGATGGEKPSSSPVPFPAGEEAGLVNAQASPAGAATPAEEVRPASPTFGGTVPAEESGAGAGTAATTPPPVADVDAAAAAAAAKQQLEAEERARQEAEAEKAKQDKYARQKKLVKYAASGDPFYPVELEGVVYDSFGLRIVFERDKTGFEESKEFPIRMNSVVAARYQILEYLGSAAFSRAVQCLDLETNKMVCMKIIKNDKDFFDQSLDEIKLLKYINVNGDVDENCVLRLYDYFYHKEHLIIVTELLRDNLYEFSKFNRECGDEPYFTLGRLQRIAKQVLTSLDYVHSLRLIHCDLKPENILIRSYSRCEVKVIDFGSSCFVDDHLSSYVQSRSYRAPEVMLGLPYDQKIDLWSLGCILAELWTGYVLFQNDSVQSLLARILGIVGEFPYHLMTRGRYVPQYFTQDGQLYQEIDGPACPDRGRRLHLLVPKKSSLQQRMRTDSPEFLDFLTSLLHLDPSKRPTAAEALEHPWLAQCKYSDGL
jgi:serine/threonine protein kinase